MRIGFVSLPLTEHLNPMTRPQTKSGKRRGSLKGLIRQHQS